MGFGNCLASPSFISPHLSLVKYCLLLTSFPVGRAKTTVPLRPWRSSVASSLLPYHHPCTKHQLNGPFLLNLFFIVWL